MSLAPEALLEQALSLSPADRAELASGLLASLDDDRADEHDVERLWSEETERRMAQLASGEAAASPVTRSWRDLPRFVPNARRESEDRLPRARYRVIDDTILVTAVYHQRRHPDFGSDRSS